jgi:hypothetical protein
MPTNAEISNNRVLLGWWKLVIILFTTRNLNEGTIMIRVAASIAAK